MPTAQEILAAAQQLQAPAPGSPVQGTFMPYLKLIAATDELVSIPAAGRKQGSLITADNLQLQVNIPEGLYPIGYKLEFHIILGGAVGAGVSAISSLIKQLIVTSEKFRGDKFEGYVDGQSTIDYVALESITKQALPMNKVPVVDPVVAANATDYFGSWIVWHPIAGRQLQFEIQTSAPSGLAGFGTAPTSATYDAMVTVFCQKVKPERTDLLYAKLQASMNQITLPDFAGVVDDQNRKVIDSVWMGSQSEFSGILSGLTIGEQTLNNPQINILEELWNYLAQNAGTINAVTTGVGNQTYGTLDDPKQVANAFFALYQKLVNPGTVQVASSTPTNTYFVTRTSRRMA